MTSQETETAGGSTPDQRREAEGYAPGAPSTGGYRPATGGFPASPGSAHARHPGPTPYPQSAHPPVHPYPGAYIPGPAPAPTGPQSVMPVGPYAWDPADDVDDPRPAGNPAAAFSVVLGLLAALISFRPLAFGSMVMAWDTYVALGIAVLALALGGMGVRTAARRPVAVVGIALSVLALLVVAALPTF